jgi:hypothetical protein
MTKVTFSAKRIDRNETVEGYYFTTPLTDENSGVDSKFGWFFLSDCTTRHCISTVNGIVYVIDETTLNVKVDS